MRVAVFDLGSRRADTILLGSLILIECLEYFSFKGFEVSTKGVRFGLAKDMLF